MKTWPIGLRIIFWVVALSLIVGTFQMMFWVGISGEFFPKLTFQGAYAGIAYFLECFAFIMAFIGKREAFVGLILTSRTISTFAGFYFVTIGVYRFCNIYADHFFVIGQWAESIGLYLGYNLILVGIHLMIIWYIWKFELRFAFASESSS